MAKSTKPYILGLDLGVQSVGWAMIDLDDDGKPVRHPPVGGPLLRQRRRQRDRNRQRKGRIAEHQTPADAVATPATLAARPTAEEDLSLAAKGRPASAGRNPNAGTASRTAQDTRRGIVKDLSSRPTTVWPAICCPIVCGHWRSIKRCRRSPLAGHCFIWHSDADS